MAEDILSSLTNVTSTEGGFGFKNGYINRDKTGSPYKAAHPDSTILAAGPARFTALGGQADAISGLTLIGATNSIAIMESQAVQPLKELGSSRYIFTTNNNPVTVQMNSLLLNGPNLLKVLHANAENLNLAGTGVTEPDYMDTQFLEGSDYNNLDFPIFSIPFGLVCIARSISLEEVNSVYVECTLVQNWAWRIQAGQSMVFTDVTLIADRTIPLGHLANDTVTALQDEFDKVAAGGAA